MVLPKILIAEDDKVTQALYKKGLPDKLCTTKIAGNGQDTISLFEKWRPDIILLDYGLPIINGYQALRAIRGSEFGAETTIIMVSSKADKDHIVACARLGIQGYIVKPFKTDEIAHKIFQLHKATKK